MGAAERVVYFDHAATSHPKDPRVIQAVVRWLGEVGGNPGRGSHPGARQAQAMLDMARERCRRLVGARSGAVSFCLNATDALNMALKGVLGPGDEVVTTQIEHNSVMRPLRGLQRRSGLRLLVAPADSQGRVAAEEIVRRVGPRTRLLAMAHASNVSGALQPVVAVANACRERGFAGLLLVDAAQTAGYRPLDEISAVADLIAVAGHKGPGGPLGTGFLWRRLGLRLRPWREGGTGTDSRSAHQPVAAPEDLEAGSPNVPGIAGLSEAIRIRLEGGGLEQVLRARRSFGERFLELLQSFLQVESWGPSEAGERELVFPLRIRGMAVEESSVLAELEGGVVQRDGLHCAPGAHRALGTDDRGTMRWSFGARPSDEDFARAWDTLRLLTQSSAGAERTGAGKNCGREDAE